MLGAPLMEGAITPGRFDLAPGAIREALARFSTWDFHERHDLRELSSHDFGNLALQQLQPEQALEPLAGAVRHGLSYAQAMVVIGGHNAITWAGVHGLGPELGRVGLLTMDAHLDLRTLDHGLVNGNPVRALLRDGLQGANVVQLGIQSFANSPAYARVASEAGIHVVSAEEVRERGITEVVEGALHELARNVDSIYVDLDLDALDRASAPATGGARPGGLTAMEVRRAAFLAGRHPKVAVMDLVEVDPSRDVADVTVLAAAACLLSFASGMLSRLKGASGSR